MKKWPTIFGQYSAPTLVISAELRGSVGVVNREKVKIVLLSLFISIFVTISEKGLSVNDF